MFAINRFGQRARLLIILLLVSLFLSACTSVLNNGSWPGLNVDGDVVYVARGIDVRAVNIAEQREVWSYPEETNAQLNFFAAPEVQGEAIVLGDYGAAGGFFSPNVTVSIYSLDRIDSANPTTRWIADEVAADRIIGQPSLVDDTVYVTTADNFLFALDADSGGERWSFEADHSFWAQPFVVDGVIYLSSMDHSLYALDARNGNVMWQTTLDGALPSAPAYDNGTLYVGSFSGNLYAIDSATGDELWSYTADDWIWSTPTVAGEAIYFADGSGKIYAINRQGGDVIWQQEANGPCTGRGIGSW